MVRRKRPISGLNYNKNRQPTQAPEAAQQLSLLPPILPQKERLQIASCPIAERDEDSIYRYIFILRPSNIRVCGGRYSADEAHEIFHFCSSWDWRILPNNIPNHRARLERIIDVILAEQASERPASGQGRAA